MRVGELCNREVVIADRSMSVPEGARLMRQHHVGDLVIIEEHGERCFPVGIVTDRDLVVEVLANNLAPETLSLGDIMTFDLITAREDDDPLDIIKRMRDKGIRRMPVVTESGCLVGILTMDDVLDLIAEQLADLVILVGREQRREVDRQPPE